MLFKYGGFAELQGGDFGSSFLSGFTGSIAGSMITAKSGDKSFFGAKNDGGKYLARRTVAAAVVGGTTSEIAGGKFANGAATAAMVHLLNHEGGEFTQDKAIETRVKGIIYDEYEVVGNKQAGAVKGWVEIGRRIERLLKIHNDGDPLSRSVVSDWLTPNQPASLGGSYSYVYGSYPAGADYVRSEYRGSFVLRTLTRDSSPRFFEALSSKGFNLNEVSAVNVRRHYTRRTFSKEPVFTQEYPIHESNSNKTY